MDNGIQSIGDVFKLKQTKKAPSYQWQDLALRIIKELNIPNFKRSSVFKACRDNSRETIERAMNDTKELCQTGERWKYFFKIIGGKAEKK
jgi:hypothetical protein